MNGVVHQNPNLLHPLLRQPLLHGLHPVSLELLRGEVFRDHKRMDRPPHIAGSDFMKRHLFVGSRQRLTHLHGLVPCRRDVALGQAVHAPERLT